MMTGPIFARITQSFLDALNNGAVPTITSSWQVSMLFLCALFVNLYDMKTCCPNAVTFMHVIPTNVLNGSAHCSTQKKN